ncbi:MAG: GGDEF domain-containing protein [Shewanella sp.]|nr:GGDEF domain-containing protein [Shewanella sp.]MCF1429346.1 GGDEF domain-containing protein [Shewanella sp.]MCF1456506.1 GGDEF domain-containing protein [Shewanella sp.]
MTYCNEATVCSDNPTQKGNLLQLFKPGLPGQAELFNLLQYLHASLDPQEVFEAFATLAGKYLPLAGVQLSFDCQQLQWGECNAQGLSRPFVLRGKTGTLKYYLLQPINGTKVMALLESLLQQPMHNALQHADIRRQALIDTLTGLGNRRLFERNINQSICRSQRSAAPLSLLILDLDNFKQLNDTLGHEVGDRVLTEFGMLLQNTIRASDQAFRLGGDEFVILVEGDKQGCARLCQRILAGLANHPPLARYAVKVTLGGTQYRQGDDMGSLYRRADKALYQGKKAGRNNYRLAG